MTHAEIIEHLRRVAEEKASKDSRLSIPSEFLEGIAADAIIDLEARLRIAERRAEDAERLQEKIRRWIDMMENCAGVPSNPDSLPQMLLREMRVAVGERADV